MDIDQIKKEAIALQTKTRKETGIKPSRGFCLNEVAKKNGFKSFGHLKNGWIPKYLKEKEE